MTKTPLVPSFIYGTAWKEDRTAQLVTLALRAGFRAFDTANQRKHYFEAAMGDALAEAITGGSMKKLSGRPITIWAAAQAKQVLRQPMVSSPHALNGHPTVEAKPAISVMPVIERRAASP